MSKLTGLLLYFVVSAWLHAADLNWLTDHDAALALAKKEQKRLLIDFTGSTWCPPCIALHQEVVSQPAFAAWSKDMVLLTLDFPRASERTPEKIAADPALARLMELKNRYGVPGYPTLIVLAPDGAELGRVVGYEKGAGPKKYLAEFGAKVARSR